jgi:hypothetical protein
VATSADAPTTTDAPAESATDAGGADPCANDAGVVVYDGGCAEQIASGQDDPRFVAVAAATVLWTSFGTGTGTITKADLDGANQVPTSVGGHPMRIVVHGGDIYWGETTSPTETGITGTVNRRKIGVTAVTTVAGGIYSPRGIAVTDAYVYFTARDGVLYRVDNVDGGPPFTVANGLVDPQGVTADDMGVLVAVAGNDANNPGVVTARTSTGTLSWETPATGHVFPFSVTGNMITVFWTERGKLDAGAVGSIVKTNRSDGMGTTKLCPNDQPLPTELVTGSTDVYFLNLGLGANGGELRRVKKDGSGTCELLVSGLANPGGIDLGFGYVYWTTRGDGRVWRMKVE